MRDDHRWSAIPSDAVEPCSARSKAMSLVAATVGVDSVALARDVKDQVVVISDVIDSIMLTTALKKVGHAQLVLVGDAKKEKPAEATVATTAVDYTYPWHYYRYHSNAAPVYEHPASAYDSARSAERNGPRSTEFSKQAALPIAVSF
ncbi:hypothetical protein ACQ4PT_036685 [Festuca glaucescens]